MRFRGIWAAWALALVAAVGFDGALAQEASPQAFLEAIYRPYAGKNFKGTRINTPAEVRRHFDAPLAAAILKDRAAAAKRKEVPTSTGSVHRRARSRIQHAVKPRREASDRHRHTHQCAPSEDRDARSVKTAVAWRITEIRAPSGLAQSDEVPTSRGVGAALTQPRCGLRLNHRSRKRLQSMSVRRTLSQSKFQFRGASDANDVAGRCCVADRHVAVRRVGPERLRRSLRRLRKLLLDQGRQRPGSLHGSLPDAQQRVLHQGLGRSSADRHHQSAAGRSAG